jgi:hypothetical protein
MASNDSHSIFVRLDYELRKMWSIIFRSRQVLREMRRGSSGSRRRANATKVLQ